MKCQGTNRGTRNDTAHHCHISNNKSSIADYAVLVNTTDDVISLDQTGVEQPQDSFPASLKLLQLLQAAGIDSTSAPAHQSPVLNTLPKGDDEIINSKPGSMLPVHLGPQGFSYVYSKYYWVINPSDGNNGAIRCAPLLPLIGRRAQPDADYAAGLTARVVYECASSLNSNTAWRTSGMDAVRTPFQRRE